MKLMWKNYRLFVMEWLVKILSFIHMKMLIHVDEQKLNSFEATSTKKNTLGNVISMDMRIGATFLVSYVTWTSLPLEMLFLLHSIVTMFMHFAHTIIHTVQLGVIITSYSTVQCTTPVDKPSIVYHNTVRCVFTYRTIGNQRSACII